MKRTRKQPTDNQIHARRRNFTKWRIMGMHKVLDNIVQETPTVLTSLESHIFGDVRDILENRINMWKK